MVHVDAVKFQSRILVGDLEHHTCRRHERTPMLADKLGVAELVAEILSVT